MAVADLIYSIAGDSSKFIKALQQADKQLQKSIDGMSAMSKAGAYVTAGLGAAATAMGELSRQALNDMVAIQRSVERTGISAEELSKLGYAASLVGLQLDDVADATFEIALKLGEAGQNEKAAIEAFQRLGIAIKDSAGNLRSASDVTSDFFDAITKVPDAATRAALAAGVLGDDVSLKMSPMLAQGTEALKSAKEEAERFGLVMTSQASEGAAQFQQNLTRLQGVADGLGRQIVEVFTPALTVMTNAMVDNASAADNMASRQQAAIGVMRGAMVVVRTLGFGFQMLGHWIAAFAAGVVNETQLAGAGIKHFVDMAKSSLDPRTWNKEGDAARAKIRQTFSDALAQRNMQQDYLTGQRDALIKSWQDDIDGIMNASAQATQKAIQQPFVGPTLAQAGKVGGAKAGKAFVQAVKKEVDAGAKTITLAQGVGGDVVARAQQVANDRQEQVGGAFVAAMAAAAEAQERAAERTKALQDDGLAITDSTRTGVEQLQKEYARLGELQKAGAIDAQTYARAVQALGGDEFLTDAQRTQAELDRLNELLRIGAIDAAAYDVALNKLFPSAEKSFAMMDKLGATAATSLADSFQQFLFDPFNTSLGDMVKSFIGAIARMVTEVIAKQAVLALFGGANASPAVTAALGFADGGYVAGPGTGTSDSIPARLSNGEYVMPAKTVSHFGVDFMDAIRAMRPARQAPVARFAEGGYVNQQASSGGGVRVVNVVDSSMVQDFLTSSAGEQVILNTIRRNRRQVSQVMG